MERIDYNLSLIKTKTNKSLFNEAGDPAAAVMSAASVPLAEQNQRLVEVKLLKP